jgi:diguanylate cyclase (GGDEF)-like protein
VLALRSTLLKRRNRQLEALVHERTEALSAANRQLTLQANSDGLTGLLNRRRFDADWPQALAEAAHHGRPVALLLIDLDHFKRYNDRHGHLMGDERLRACADWLAECADSTSGATVYRYGGEEFATILTGSTPVEAEAYAVELCEGAERRFGPDGTTLSIGLRCAVPGPAEDPLAWLAAVDAALYAAKHAGRNRVRVQRGEGPTGSVSAPDGR